MAEDDAPKRTPVPPRLFVIMAGKAPVAVVLRRGPTAWVEITLWDTSRDVFAPGAWFHGRIFGEKCDLSPDGSLFVYAAYKGRWASTYTDSWTAVSRPPWLHALSLWPVGTTYGGGGRFVDDRRLVLRAVGAAHPDHPVRGLEVVEGEAEHQRSTGEVEGAEWSGRDQGNRLVYAARGCIFARTGGEDRLLGDFNDHVPHSAPPPAWATQPLEDAATAGLRRRKK